MNLISALPQTIFWIGAIIFLITSVLLAYSLIGFQRRAGENIDSPSASSSNIVLETVWTLIPTAILAVLLVLTFQSMN